MLDKLSYLYGKVAQEYLRKANLARDQKRYDSANRYDELAIKYFDKAKHPESEQTND